MQHFLFSQNLIVSLTLVLSCISFYCYYLLTYSIHSILLFYWAIPEKKTNRGVEDMEFPGMLKKEHVKIPRVN